MSYFQQFRALFIWILTKSGFDLNGVGSRLTTGGCLWAFFFLPKSVEKFSSENHSWLRGLELNLDLKSEWLYIQLLLTVCFLNSKCLKTYKFWQHMLELKQCKNDSVQSKIMLVLKLPRFFITYHRGKSVAISKLGPFFTSPNEFDLILL